MQHIIGQNAETLNELLQRNKMVVPPTHELYNYMYQIDSLNEYVIPKTLIDIEMFNIDDEMYLKILRVAHDYIDAITILAEVCQQKCQTFKYLDNICGKEYVIIKIKDKRFLFDANDFIMRAFYVDMTKHLELILKKFLNNGTIVVNDPLYKKIHSMMDKCYPEYINSHIKFLV